MTVHMLLRHPTRKYINSVGTTAIGKTGSGYVDSRQHLLRRLNGNHEAGYTPGKYFHRQTALTAVTAGLKCLTSLLSVALNCLCCGRHVWKDSSHQVRPREQERQVRQDEHCSRSSYCVKTKIFNGVDGQGKCGKRNVELILPPACRYTSIESLWLQMRYSPSTARIFSPPPHL